MRAGFKVCITGSEKTVEQLEARIIRYNRYLNEIRADYLMRPGEVFRIFDRLTPNIIFACRRKGQGGYFNGSDEELFALLYKAARDGARFIDIEFTLSPELKSKVYSARGSGSISSNIILSYHLYEPLPETSRLVQLATEMESEPADIIKVAALTHDTYQLDGFHEIAPRIKKPKILIGMGAGGVASRIVPEIFGSCITYLSPSKELKTAPGQLTHDDFVLFRKNRHPLPVLTGICGGEQILNSHGLRVYNRIFSTEGINATYLPFVTKDIKKTVEFLKKLNCKGVSVTTPLKQDGYKICDGVSEEAKKAEAINTIKMTPEGVFGYNTDVTAARRIFSEVKSAFKDARTVAIIGAGGAARAVCVAVKSSGLESAIFNRTFSRAKKLAESFSMDAYPINEIKGMIERFDIIVNCTTVGMDSELCPVEADGALKGKIVVDLVSHPLETTLIKKSRRAGAKMVITGVQFWLYQGQEQMKILVSRNIDLKKMQKVIMI